MNAHEQVPDTWVTALRVTDRLGFSGYVASAFGTLFFPLPWQIEELIDVTNQGAAIPIVRGQPEMVSIRRLIQEQDTYRVSGHYDLPTAQLYRENIRLSLDDGPFLRLMDLVPPVIIRDPSVPLAQLYVACGMAKNRKEARQLSIQGSLSINHRNVSAACIDQPCGMTSDKVIQVRKWHKRKGLTSQSVILAFNHNHWYEEGDAQRGQTEEGD